MRRLLVSAFAAFAVSAALAGAAFAGGSCGDYGTQTVSVPTPVDTAGSQSSAPSEPSG